MAAITVLLALCATAARPVAAQAPPAPPAPAPVQVEPALPKDAFNGPYHLNVVPERIVRITMTLSQTIPGGRIRDWQLMLCDPPRLDRQPDAILEELKVDGAPARASVVQERNWGRPLYFCHIPVENEAQASSVTVEATFRVTLCSIQLVPGAAPSPVAPLSGRQKAQFTARTRFYDYAAPQVRQFMRVHDLTRKPGETDLGFAWRALVTVRKSLRYVDPNTTPVPPLESSPGELSFSATAAAERGTAECLGSNALFRAVLRFNGIPAKDVGGRRSPDNSDSAANRGAGPHSVTLFWADGVGWVPADATAWTDHSEADHDDSLTMFGYDSSEMFSDIEDLDYSYPMLNGDPPLLAPYPRWCIIPYDGQQRQLWENKVETERYQVRLVKALNTGWRATQRAK